MRFCFYEDSISGARASNFLIKKQQAAKETNQIKNLKEIIRWNLDPDLVCGAIVHNRAPVHQQNDEFSLEYKAGNKRNWSGESHLINQFSGNLN